MKKLIHILFLCCFALGWNPGCAQPGINPKVGVGETVPNFTMELTDGRTISMDTLHGKVVVLNFWATWCKYCLEELKEVQENIIERYSAGDLVFIAIARGEDLARLNEFRERSGYRFLMAADPDESIFHLFAENFIPRNFVVDREGTITGHVTGFNAELFNELLETIDRTLK